MWLASLLLATLVAAGAPSFAGGAAAPGRLELSTEAKPPPGLPELSMQIAAIQRVMQRGYNIDTVFIVGGSSRAVLDATYGFRPLAMRDLDLFATSNAGDAATRRMTVRLAGDLARLGYTQHPVEDRLRGNPALGAAGVNFNAGYGFFLDRPGDPTVVDISLLRSEAAFKLNGPLDIDRIRIPIRADRTLLDVWQGMRGKPYRQLVREGHVLDADGGYEGWRTGRPRLVNPGDVWSDVERMKPRLVKSFLKAGSLMPLGLLRQLRDEPQRRPRQPDLELRYTQRVLSLPLPSAVEGLRLLQIVHTRALKDPRLQDDPRYQQVAAVAALDKLYRRHARIHGVARLLDGKLAPGEERVLLRQASAIVAGGGTTPSKRAELRSALGQRLPADQRALLTITRPVSRQVSARRSIAAR